MVIKELKDASPRVLKRLENVANDLQEAWIEMYKPRGLRWIVFELDKACLWIMGKGETETNYGHFFTKWLARAAEFVAQKPVDKPVEYKNLNQPFTTANDTCAWCGDTGFISAAEHGAVRDSAVFKCPCPWGRAVASQRMPYWSQEAMPQYRMVPYVLDADLYSPTRIRTKRQEEEALVIADVMKMTQEVFG